VYIVGLGAEANATLLDDVAMAGGTDHARITADVASLQATLSETIDGILQARR